MSLRYTTAGESHGRELMAIVEGVPSGLRLQAADINTDLARRQLGYGRGGRMRIETDRVVITSGVRQGLTLGTPIGFRIRNADWQNWKEIMSPGKPAGKKGKKLSVPRPGHADLAGLQKFGFSDIRNVLERASARETAARVAAGAIARRLLDEFDVAIYSRVMQIGKARDGRSKIQPEDFRYVDKSIVRAIDKRASLAMKAEIDSARKAGESLGGIFEVRVFGLPPGLGSYASGCERLGGRIGGALMSIPAIKGVEIGDGFAAASRPGSAFHDEIYFKEGHGYYRKTNHAGGLEGGITNGEPVVARACMKPIPTLTSPLKSVDIRSGVAAPAFKERGDICAVPAAAVVGEAVVAIELARAMLAKFGGDCLDDLRASYRVYLKRLRDSWPPL